MSLHETRFFSNTLQMLTTVEVILPEAKNSVGKVPTLTATSPKFPVIWLLHGLSDDESAWLRYSNIERYASDYGYAIVMPRVDRSFYTDMSYGPNYWTYLTTELYQRMQFFYPLATEPENNIVAGLSMGGYGALKYGLNFPERFRAIGAFSPVINIAKFQHNTTVNMQDWSLVFGGRPVKDTSLDIDWLISAKNPQQAAVKKLAVYTAAGDVDFMRAENEAYRSKFDATFAHYQWHLGTGGHEWRLWDAEMQHFLAWVAKL